MKKPKMVKAWAFAYGKPTWTDIEIHIKKSKLQNHRSFYASDCGCMVGPIVRIEVPAPKEASK